MPYQKKEINPLSGQRLKEEMKRSGYTQAKFAKKVFIDVKALGHICQGKRRLTEDRAIEFGKILHVRAEYLLGLDDFRVYNKEWFQRETAQIIKDGAFFEQCLAFFNYEIVGNRTDFAPEDPEEILTLYYKIKKPTGEIIEIDDSKIDSIQKEIFSFIRFKLENM